MPCGRKFTAGSNPALSAEPRAGVTQVVVTPAFAIPGRARRTPFVASFVAFCGGRVLRGWHGEGEQEAVQHVPRRQGQGLAARAGLVSLLPRGQSPGSSATTSAATSTTPATRGTG